MISFIYSSNSVTVILNGVPSTIDRSHDNYALVIEAIKVNDLEAIARLVSAPAQLAEKFAKFGEITVFGGHITFNDRPLHGYLVDRILEMADLDLPISAVANFLDNVQANPSFRAVQDLYKWCEASKLPITEDGCIVAYKIVDPNYLDIHTHTFDNHIGQRVSVGRNEVDEDPNRTCSYGLHFCSAAYLPRYGVHSDNHIMLVKVNPRDVVAFPTDYGLSKARCCAYEVIEEVSREDAAEFFKNCGFVFTSDADQELQDYATGLGMAKMDLEDGLALYYTLPYEASAEMIEGYDDYMEDNKC